MIVTTPAGSAVGTLDRDVWDSGLRPAFESDRREAIMAGKDKGGRSAKTPAAKSKKEKRQSKKDNKAAKTNDRHLPS